MHRILINQWRVGRSCVTVRIWGHMGLWISIGWRATVQVCIGCWPWWKPMLHLYRNEYGVTWSWECGPVTIRRFR